ncbi:L-glutamine:2-deoxy-scyllo-inosose aminotransferase (plasmid) [Labrenzia sp. THAF191b]|uniref:DegT/DnrJ/EryC1/StrS family aminotransferase n=1 Tax=unclassified Labrenzia TaxID=2648686 RepID=UPI001268004B|nr:MULTISPECIES: DegT/DnrJ/EryC1/StrS aminotransferase family protein [unclassified Labrenzia]QFT01741.1 L-glutamine:2-deoxy-scyllo-inosose aminotransferase [Labrenzia sp. THAF191b]QFT07946.1 L-glutamine:2-deoxy-scyllo-inosose aminotransferase [Labrenzia sp. THAF191a]QFT19689.1 L-glutamine:2-deoxy-scyllo-inosose aminotransferase [Labrenzia sp. THAF187b]
MGGWPVYTDEEIDAVTGVLRSGKVNAWTGPDVFAFETEYCDYTGAAHAIAMANGSVTLDTALRILDIQPGDEVIVTPRSFVASASCVLLAGGIPVFADIDPDSQNITPETIAPLITSRTVGILPVHLAGWPCDMDGILALARAHNIWVIEDCAQAHGAMIGERHVGTLGDFGSYSFCQDKIISTGGEGGMLLTDNPELWSRAWSFKDHGKGYATVFEKDHQPGFRWLHDSGPGTNLRMAGPSAAIGRIQLSRLAETRAHRTRNALTLAEILSGSSALRVPVPPQSLTHAYYRFYAFVRPEAMADSWSRDRILAEIAEAGLPAFSGSCSEIYREALFRDRGLGPDKPLPVAKQLGETSLAFLVDTTWEQERIIELAEKVASIADRSLAVSRKSPAKAPA